MYKRYKLLIEIEEKSICQCCNSQTIKREYKPLQTSNGKIYELTKKECLKYIDSYNIENYKIVGV